MMIKAKIKIREVDLGFARVVIAIIYDYNSHRRTITARLEKEVQVPLDGEYTGKTMVVQQSISKEEQEGFGYAAAVHDVDGCTFLDLIGNYNKAGNLLDIEVIWQEGNEND